MKLVFKRNILAATLGTLFLTACGDSKTHITELEPTSDTAETQDHNHDHSDLTIESAGRLVVLAAQSNEARVYDLDDNSLLDSFSLVQSPGAIKSSAGGRYAMLVSRNDDYIGFVDGGLWREDHGDHMHDYKQNPTLSDFSLQGSRPTHVTTHEGKTAVFYDGDADTSTEASVIVLSDNDITQQSTSMPGINYTTNMHGVALARGDHLLSVLRRDDAESTSSAKILPDQVAVYHLHEGEYEQEQVLDTLCPDLHGAAQNQSYVAFGCSDGVLLVHAHGDVYESHKLAAPASFDAGTRIGALYGHQDVSELMASASGVWLGVDPETESITVIDWQPVENANVISAGFSAHGEHFLLLDDKGYLTLLTPNADNASWQFSTRIDVTEGDLSAMPEDTHLSLAISGAGDMAYVADPESSHVVVVDLALAQISARVALDVIPKSMTWLGITESH